MGTIFIVEDEDSIRELLEVLFSAEGYKVVPTSSIGEFSRLHKQCAVNLYLLDIRLPDGSGIDVCNRLKDDISTAHIPVLMMSAHAKTHEIEDSCRPEAFITNPSTLIIS